MSHGPGKWQRAILERTNKEEIVTIPDLLDSNFDHCQSYSDMINRDWSQRVSIERAIKTLAKRGMIKLGWACFSDGYQKAYQNQWCALPLSVDYSIKHLDTKGNPCTIRPEEPGTDKRKSITVECHYWLPEGIMVEEIGID
jgi:hypothetical protein